MKSNFMIFFNENKGSTLRFFLKIDVFKMYLKIIYFKKNIRVLPWFSLKKHHKIGFHRVKSII